MANIFESYFNEDEEQDKLLPSQKAAQEQKVETNIFSDYFKGEEYVSPKRQIVEEVAAPPKDERNILQKGVEFVKNVFKKKEPPKPEEQVMEVQGKGLTANDLYLGTVQSNKNLSPEIEKTKEQIVNKYVDLVRKNPSLLNKPKRGAFDVTSADVLLENAKLALQPEREEELRAILKQKLEENNYQMLSTNEFGMQDKEAKDLAKQYRNQIKTSELFNEIINDGATDGDFRESVKEGFDVPFLTPIKNVSDALDLFSAMRKNARGEELTAGDKAVLERAAAKEIENALDPKSFGYNLGKLLTAMPSYIVEYASTLGIARGVSTATKGLPAVQKIATKSPFLANTIGFLAGTSVQTGTGFMPRVLEKTMEYSTKTQDFAYSKEGDLLAQNLDTAKPLTEIAFKNLPKAYAYTWVEVASESAGEGITYLKKGLLSKFFAKHADEGVEGTINLAKTLGWNGILEEIAEEEIANVGQAPIEGQPINPPFVTKEGTERLLLETIGIGIMGTVMQTPTNAYNKAQYNKAVNQIKQQGKELGMSDAEVESVIKDLQTQAQAPEGVEEAVPPVEGAEEPVGGAIEEEEPQKEKTQKEVDEDMIEIAIRDLKAQGIEETPENVAVQNISYYMRQPPAEGATRYMANDTVEQLKGTGVDEMGFDESGNITLYRDGAVSEDNINSFSLEKKFDTQDAYIVPKGAVVLNLTSQQMEDVFKRVYGEGSDAIDALRTWKQREAEVIVKPTKEFPVQKVSGDNYKNVELTYIRNKEKAPKMGERFGQDIEPAGKYISIIKPTQAFTPEGFERGTIKFVNPLVVEFGGNYGTDTNWKSVLSKRFDGKTGVALSQAIKEAGYDGIITTDEKGNVSESVSLQEVQPTKKKITKTAQKKAEVVEKEVSKPVKEVKKPVEVTTEAPKKAVSKEKTGIDKIIEEDKETVYKQAVDAFGEKSLTDLTAKQLGTALAGMKIINPNEKIMNKFGNQQRTISLSELKTRPTFLYGGVSRGVFTDGYLMILDEDVAKDVNEENIENFRQKQRKEYMKTLSLTYEEADALATKDVEKGIEEFSKEYPAFEKIIPNKDELEKAEIVGISAVDGNGVFVLKSDNYTVTVDADKFQFVKKAVGDSDIYVKPEKPVLFTRRGKNLGLVMPLMGGKGSFEERVNAAYEKEPKVEDIPNVSSGYATYSTGSFKTPNEIRDDLGMAREKPLQFPEITRLAREIVKSVPSVKKPRARDIGVPAGYFSPSAGEYGGIFLNPDIFKDAKLMEQVLAHELGHAIDYVPDATMSRGNLLGRMASLRNFLRQTFTDLETEARVDELTREQNQLQGDRAALKDESGNIKNKEMYKELGNRLSPINKELEKIKKSAKYKNEVIFNELKNITQLWNPFNDNPSKEILENYAKAKGISPVEAEMIYKKYIKYRYSSAELYAEALSALFNMPDVLKVTAPNFYQGFFENLDRKPEVKDSYFKIQELLSGGTDVLSERQKVIRDSFQKGEDLIRQQREEKKNADREYTFRLKYELIDKNQRVIDKVNQAIKEGKYVNPDDNPVYWLEGHNYVGGVVKNYVEDYVQPLYNKVNESGLSWEDLGEVLFLERVIKERGDIPSPVVFIRENDPDSWEIIKDRLPEGIEGKSTTKQLQMLKEEFTDVIDSTTGETLYDQLIETMPKGLANPFGMTNETAQAQLKFLESQLGEAKWNKLQEVLDGFRKATNHITVMAANEGFWKPEIIKQIAANPAYATFQVLDYVKEFVPASISHQVGTLKDIANPADATVAKSVSIIRAIEKNKVKKKIVRFMQNNFPDEIEEAKYTWDGKRRVPAEPKDPSKQALFTTIEDGTVKGYYVDPYIANTMDISSTGEMNGVMEVFKLFNSKAFRPMFITFNLGFQSFNLFRDFFRFYKNIPDMSIARAAKAYAKAAPEAFRRAWNISDETVKQMEKSRILGVTYNDVIRGATTEDKRIDVLLARAGVTRLKGKKLPAILKPIDALLTVIERTGNMIETLPKVAAYKELSGTMPKEELASKIRSQVGSPDFLRRGSAYKVYNELFLFSNSIKEGIRSDLAVATNPKTRAGWWIKTAKLNIIPKLLMWAVLSGLFGDKLRRMMEDVSEYDKTNYTIIPIGEDETGKTIYIRVPQDETGRLIGGIFWKIMRATNNNQPAVQDLTDIISLTGGQLPTINPLITAISGATQYMAGKNPYDYYRGRNVIPDTEFKAGGKYAFKPFANWMLQTLGLGTIMSGYVSEQAPETKTWIQKVVETPVLSNIVGRWVKVSDYGQTEKNKQIVKNEEQAQAQKQIEERRKLEDAVKEYQSGAKSIVRKNQILDRLIKDVVGDPPYRDTRKAKVTNLRKKFSIALIKGTADANVTSLIYANTNAEKLALLKEIKTSMSLAEFNKLKGMLIDEKIVSKEVFKELK